MRKRGICVVRIAHNKKTTDQFKKEIFEIYGTEYIVLGEYNGATKHVLVKHTTCGAEFQTLPTRLLKSIGCKDCSILKRRLSTDSFQDKLNSLYGEKIKVIGEYIKYDIPITVRCEDCGHIRTVARPHELIRKPRNGHRRIGCPNCSTGNLFDTLDDFIYKLENKNPDVKYISGYTRSDEKVLVECKKCGSEWSTKAGNLINAKSGCPDCNSFYSKAVIQIKKFLDDNNINNKQEYHFDNLRSSKGYMLKFDFAILDEFDNLKILIEYDGEQHFTPVKLWGGEKSFIESKIRDEQKNEYCKDNNIKLIRFSYKDKMIFIKNTIIKVLEGDV